MNRKMLVSQSVRLLVLLILVAACGQQESSPPPTATMSEAADACGLVFISDSSGRVAAGTYANIVESDLGVDVALDEFTISELSARSVANYLRDPEALDYNLRLKTLNLAERLSEAEVIVFYGNPRSEDAGDWSCVEEPFYVVDCSPQTFDAYREDLRTIYEHIFQLRGDSPIIVRAFDAYNPLYSAYRERGVFDECLQCWENYNEAIHQVAAEYGVPVAPVFDTFNGSDHSEDPREKGYISSDGQHTSGEGARVIAGLLRDLGYEPTRP